MESRTNVTKKKDQILLKDLTIYMKKFLDCDWLREMQFLGNTVQKKGNLVQEKGNKRDILIG